MRSPFSLYVKKLKSGPFWYARFYNPTTNEYSISRSTGVPCVGQQGNKRRANRVASEMVEELCLEKSPFLIDYLEAFWKEGSPYLKYKRLVEKKPLSAYYVKLNANGIKNHVKPYKPFLKLLVSDLRPGIIEDWKVWALERGTGTRRVNSVMQAISVAIRYAVSRGDLKADPFLSVKKVTDIPKEKGILNNEEVGKLIEFQDYDPRVTLSIHLAVLAGLRRGEIRGLCWGDINQNTGLINVQNNYIDNEGEKSCKSGSNRQVILPKAIIPVLNKVQSISSYLETDDFILF